MPEENSDHASSDQFAPEDPFEASVEEVAPLEGGRPSPAVPGTGNRPAEGARHATPGEILDDHFQGSEAAGDFLGLDVEVLSDLGSVDEGPPDLDLAAAPNAATDLAEAQEFHLDDDGESLLEDPGIAPEYVEPEDELEYDEETEEGEELEGFDDEHAGAASPLRRIVFLTGAAFSIGLAAVSAYVFLPKYFATDAPVVQPPATGGTAVALNTDPAPPVTATDPVENPDFVPTDPVDPLVTGTDPMVFDPVPVEPDVVGVADPTPPTTTTDPPVDPFTVDLTDLGLAAAGDGETAIDGATNPAVRSGPSALDSVLLRQLDNLPVDQLEMIWWGDVAPMEAAAAPVRILMPRVGNVRIIMTSDAVFDGKLFSMGKNQIEIDTNLGRMGLAGDRVARIERLAGPPADAGEIVTDVVRGDRVRVRTLGGVLIGHVVSAKGKTVILQTEGGGRVTLHDPVIEPIGSSRAIVVEQ